MLCVPSRMYSFRSCRLTTIQNCKQILGWGKYVILILAIIPISLFSRAMSISFSLYGIIWIEKIFGVPLRHPSVSKLQCPPFFSSHRCLSCEAAGEGGHSLSSCLQLQQNGDGNSVSSLLKSALYSGQVRYRAGTIAVLTWGGLRGGLTIALALGAIK